MNLFVPTVLWAGGDEDNNETDFISDRYGRNLEFVDSLDALCFEVSTTSTRRTVVVVLDTTRPATAGEFDMETAATYLRRRHLGTRPFRVLFRTSSDASSQHLAEESAVKLRSGGLTESVSGAVCTRLTCTLKAIRAAESGTWMDKHLSHNLLVPRPILYSELRKSSFASKFMIVTAAKPTEIRRIAEITRYSEETVRDWAKPVGRTFQRLEWIGRDEPINLQRAAGLIHQRRPYIEHFAQRYEPEFYSLFEAA